MKSDRFASPAFRQGQRAAWIDYARLPHPPRAVEELIQEHSVDYARGYRYEWDTYCAPVLPRRRTPPPVVETLDVDASLL